MQSLTDHTAVLGCLTRMTTEVIAQLHDRSNGCIEGLSATVVVAHFGDGLVDLSAQCFLFCGERFR